MLAAGRTLACNDRVGQGWVLDIAGMVLHSCMQMFAQFGLEGVLTTCCYGLRVVCIWLRDQCMLKGA